jgi:hypothetical protein
MNGIRAAALLVSAATLAVVTAGCGSSSGDPGVASLGGAATTTTTENDGSTGTTAKESGGRAFAACMRSHGVPNFPDPTAGGGGISIGPGSGINPDSPQFQSAERTCQRLLPAGKRASPADQAKMRDQLLKFSACMRSHGVPNFPDPQFSAGGARVKIGGGSGINPNSPQFKQAQRECKQYLPGGGKGGPGPTTRVQAKP